MAFFVRYFVEIELPLAAVETALDEVPAEWLSASANKAHEALVGPHLAMPLLEADLEVGSLGHRRTQLAVAGRYCVPGSGINQHIDRGVGQRVGEMTIKEFVDRLADLVQTLTLGRSVSVAATRAAETMLPARHLSA